MRSRSPEEGSDWCATCLAALQISKGDLEVVRQAKARLDGQLARVAGVKEELEDLLDDDHDMRNMYLGR